MAALRRAFRRLARVPGLGPRASAVAVAVTARIVVANAVAALFVAVYLTLTEDRPDGQSWGETIAAHAVFYGFALVVFTVASLVRGDRKSTRLNSSHANISYAVFCLKKK